MLQDVTQCKMDLVNSLSRTLHGQIKPMITQCTVRHLYALPTTTPSSSSSSASSSQTTSDPITPAAKTALLNLARTLETRRCMHETPLSTLDCIRSILDPSGTGHNKHRYVLAVQDESVRAWARSEVRGVPSVYVRRSVMIMEPMAEGSRDAKEGVERGKLRAGVKKVGGVKRKREEGDGDERGEEGEGEEEKEKKKKKAWGVKGPNPLSVKKKKAIEAGNAGEDTARGERVEEEMEGGDGHKRKRIRKRKRAGIDIDGGGAVEGSQTELTAAA